MQNNWWGRLKLLGGMTIEVPEESSCETPQALKGWGLGEVKPLPSRLGGLDSIVSSSIYGFSKFRALYFA